MTNRTVEVGLRIDGDSTGAKKAASETGAALTALADDAQKVRLLDAAVTSVERFEAAVVQSQAKVRSLRETLSEAYASGADAPMIRKLEKDLVAVERQAGRADGALLQAQSTVVGLNLRFADAGISAANLSAKKAELVTRSAQVSKAAQEEAEYQAYLADETQRAAKAAAQLAADQRFESIRQAGIEYQKAAEYAGWWADAMDRDEQALSDLNAANNLDKQRQANVQTQKAAEYADWWAKELAQVDRAAQVARASTTTLNRAFSALNIRSAAQIDAEILGINQALLDLAKRADLTGDEFDRAFAAGQRRLTELKREAAGAGGALDDVGRRANIAAGLMAQLGMAFGGLELARQFLKANVELESMNRGLTQITGSAQAAAREIEWLQQVTNRLGVETMSSGRAYLSLMASAKGTNMEGVATRDIFEAVAGSMAKLGKSSADTEGALQAISQMMSKGVVSMEEMRQQLGERLPGALQATADASGLTVDKLVAMISAGNVMAEDLLPKMTAGLQKMYGTAGEIDGSVAGWNRLKNAVAQTFQSIGQDGHVMDGLVLVLELGTKAVRGFGAALQLSGKHAANVFGLISNFDFKRPIESIKEFIAAEKQALADVAESYEKGNKELSLFVDKQKQLGESAGKSSEAAKASSDNWLQVGDAYTTLTAAAENATAQAEKNAAARAEESKAALGLATALGTETQQRHAAQAAADSEARTLREVADARQHEASLALAHAETLQAMVDAEKNVSDQKRQAAREAREKAAALQAEADQSAATSLAAQQHAAALQTESDALADNSGRITELKASYEAHARTLEIARQQKEAGAITSEQFKNIEIAAAQAAALYRDALSDQVAAIQRKAAATRDALSIEQATIQLAIEQQRTIAAVAKEKGYEREAAEALVEIKRLEIKLAELAAKAKAAEAAATMEFVKAERIRLKAAGDLTVAKEAELKAAEAGAQVKKLEAEIAAETAKRMRALADATDFGRTSAQKAAKDYDKLAKSLDGVAKSASDADEELRNAADARYQSPSAGVDFSGLAKDRGAKGDQVAAVTEAASKIYNTMMADKSPAAIITPMIQKAMLSKAVDSAMVEVAAKTRSTAEKTEQESTAENTSQRSAAAERRAALQIPVSEFRINLSLNGGKTTAVNVSSRDDVTAINGFMRELESAAKRSF